MKKLILKSCTALTALAIASPALASSQVLNLDDFGCTPKMSFAKGQAYTVNATERWQVWQDELGISEPFESWQFVVEPAHAKAVKFNGAFPKSANLPADENVYFAYPNKGKNTIHIVQSFTGNICFVPLGKGYFD